MAKPYSGSMTSKSMTDGRLPSEDLAQNSQLGVFIVRQNECSLLVYHKTHLARCRLRRALPTISTAATTPAPTTTSNHNKCLLGGCPVPCSVLDPGKWKLKKA